MTQQSNSGRVVTGVVVVRGNVYTFIPGATSYTAATNVTGNTPPLNFTGPMQSAANIQKLWFADGVNWVYYTPATNQVNNWVASAGTLPVDASNNAPRLIATWRGRTVLSGLLLDPQSVFLSHVSDPTDFDYSPLSQTPLQAVAFNSSTNFGLVGDVVTGLIPYNDDILIILCDSSIYALRGDPMAGGQIDLVTRAIGGAWGQAWCQDPYGTIYFFAAKTGIFSLQVGQLPQRISQPIEKLVQDVDTGNSIIRLLWNDRYQGLHVFVTPADAPAATTHFFWEQRVAAWSTDTFTNNNHSPICCCAFDGNDAEDRVALIGSWDGYVRALSPTASDDDGYPISSSVVIGPLVTKDLDELLLKDIQGVLGETSGDVTYEVLVGSTAEEALSSIAADSGTWSAGRNLLSNVRRSGHAVYVRLTSTNAWAMEAIRARIASEGAVRRRGP